MIHLICFIEPKIKSHIGQYNRKIPIQGPQILATILKKRGFMVEIHSELQNSLRLNRIINKAEFVLITINTFNSVRGYEIAKLIKSKKDICIIFGGMHATLFPEETINFGDYVIRGEAEESIIPILENIKNNEPEKALGLSYKKGEAVFHTLDAPPPKNINILPDYKAVRSFKKRINTRFDYFMLLYASRGCTYDCDFCGNVKHFGNRVRYKDPGFIVRELRTVLDFHKKWWLGKPFMNLVWFTDDYFFTNKQKAKEILKAIIKSGIKTKIVMQSRVEIGQDSDMLKLFKEAGGHRFYLGIENISQDFLNDCNKRLDFYTIEENIKNIQSHGIEVHGLFMYGGDKYYPGTGRKIAQFAIKNNFGGILIQSMFPIPSTRFFSELRKKNRIFTYDWSLYRGLVVFFSKYIKPSVLQREMIETSSLFYSTRRLILNYGKFRAPYIIFPGEWWWQVNDRRDMNDWAKKLEEIEEPYYDKNGVLIEDKLKDMKPILPDVLKPHSHLFFKKNRKLSTASVSIY